jgi:hypothetical protein
MPFGNIAKDVERVAASKKRIRKPVSVSVPYAPTPKGKAAEARSKAPVASSGEPLAVPSLPKAIAAKKRQLHTETQRKIKRLKALDTLERQTRMQHRAEGEPGTILRQAQAHGTFPPAVEKRKYPSAYKQASETAQAKLAAHENLGEPEDITHAIEIASLAGGGTAAVKAGLKGIEEVGASKLISGGANAAESVATRVGKGAVSKVRTEAKALRSYPAKKVAKVKATPARVKSAPKRARRAVATKEGRRAAAQQTARSARRHPARSTYGAAAVSPVPLPGELDKRARAFAKGTAAALTHPGKVAETTAHGYLGFLTAPLAVGGAAVESATQGSPAPLGKELKTLGEGTLDMAKKLGSGDPKLVERTTLQETGLVPFTPVPHVLRRLKGTKAYEEARGTLRGKVEAKRAKTRGKAVSAEKEAMEGESFVPRKKARKVKQSVADTQRPGEHYVLRRTGKFVERQRARHHVSRQMSRIESEGEIAGQKVTEQVAKPLRKSKGTDQKAQNDSDALRVLVKHGIPLNDTGRSYVEMLHRNWPKVEHGDIPAGIHLDRHATKWIIDHPDIFKGKRGEALAKSVERFDSQAERVGLSDRNRYLAQVNNVINPIRKAEGKPQILKPEEMVPRQAEQFLPKQGKEWTRSEAWELAIEREEELRALRQAKDYGRAKLLERKQRGLVRSLQDLMKPPEHGGAAGGVSTTRAVAFTPEMVQRFVSQVKAEHPRLGLREPAAYVADRVPSGLKGQEKLPNFAPEIPIRKIWPSRGEAAMSGNAESSFESLMHHSAEAPRSRAATVRGFNRIFDQASRKVNGRRYTTKAAAQRAYNLHQVPPGTILVRPQALKSLLEGEHTMDSEAFARKLEGEIEHGQELAAAKDLAGGIEAAKDVKGEKFAWMDANAMHELMGHMKGVTDPLSRGMGHVTNATTRTILNSPAFEAAQFAQEGVPMAAALGRDVVNVPKAVATLKEISKFPPEVQAEISAVYGSSVGVLGAPALKAIKAEGYMDPIRAAGSKSAWRHAWELVNGTKLGKFDRARAGRFRETAGIAKFEGDYRKAAKGFNIWRRSAGNLFKDMEWAVEKMKGMTPGERQAWAVNQPKLADRMMRNMNQMGGNWNSFTVFEKHVQPYAIFYPFQRYSVLWTLYHFPLDHPIVATALAMMGQVNAQELKKIAAQTGSEPNIIDYTKPVVNGNVLPAGQRFSAILGGIQQAAVSGKPAQALSSLSPGLSAPIEALTGKNSFTGQPLGESGWPYILRQGANLSPFLRFIGAPNVGQEESPGAKAFHAQDPQKERRSFINPYIGQSGKQFAKEKQLERGFKQKYGAGHIPGPFDSKLVQDLLFGKNGKGDPSKLPAVLNAIHSSERGKEIVKRFEKPFLPPSGGFSPMQEKLLEAIEKAWETGPAGKKKKKGNPYAEALEESSGGNAYLEALKSSTGGNAYLKALE